MPQLSLYLDDDTLKKIEIRAKINQTSVSKFVTSMLKEHFSTGWPEGYKNVFGSVKDDSFRRPEAVALSFDAKRESI